MNRVLVIGATGFVGRHLAQALAARGLTVRCLARDPAKAEDLAALGCEIVRGDVTDAASVGRAFDGVEAAYICIHTLSPQPGAGDRRFMAVERAGLENIVAACRARGVRRLIYLTSVGITPDGPSEWTRERWALQQYLLESGLDVTVLQPGQIVGVGGMGFNTMVAQARAPVAVMMGAAGQRWRNIALDDLVYYLVGVLDEPRSFGGCFEVGCDDVLTSDQMVDATATILGRAPPFKIHIPPWLLSAAAPVLERVAKLPPGAFKGLVDTMGEDGVGDPMPIRAILPRPPLPYREAVTRALDSQDGAKRSHAPQ